MVDYRYKEKTLEHFNHKCKEAYYLLKQIDLHSPWVNASDAVIYEFKHGSSRKMIKSKILNKIWDYFLELEACICSCTVNDIYLYDNECPGTILKGSQADIIKICEFEWYDWIMFNDLPCTMLFCENSVSVLVDDVQY